VVITYLFQKFHIKMVPFKKLNFKHQLSFDNSFIKELKIRYGDEKNNLFYGIEYWLLNNNYYFDQVKKKLPIIDKNFTLYFMNITSKTILPHTDSGQKTVINFYFNTNNCITQFYSINPFAVQSSVKWQQRNDGQVFTSGITPSYEFTAQLGDVYILDVSTPHSVVCDTCYPPRSALCFGTNLYTFTELCEIINEY